jgi:hypothetical protein
VRGEGYELWKYLNMRSKRSVRFDKIEEIK